MKYKFEKPVEGSIGTSAYQCTIEWRNGKFISDEPVREGGRDEGPDPYTLLLSSVVSCTLITLRMYIDRKGWDIPHMAVSVNMFQNKTPDKLVTIIDRDLKILSPVTDEQRERLTDIAKSCPISKILQGEIIVRTFTYDSGEKAKHINYPNSETTVVWKPELCKHSGRCVTQLPEVFNLQAHPWVNMQGASPRRIIEQVDKCPTGALTISQPKTPSGTEQLVDSKDL
jgi:putative redox protein